MANVYRIGVQIAMSSNGTALLSVLSRNLLGVNANVDALGKGFGRLKLAIGGALAIGAGAAILGGVWKAVNASKEYANQLSLMNTLGERQVDVAKAVGAAWQTTFDVPTSGIADTLKTFRELHSVLGMGPEKMGEAGAVLPSIAKIQGILAAFTGKEHEGVGFDVVKATELRTKGAVSLQALMKNMDEMAQTITAFQGTVTASDFHSALKMSKGTALTWSDDFTYKVLPTLMQEFKTAGGGGAQSAGTYLTTLSRAVHGHIQKAAIPYWEMGGLINPRDVVPNSTGHWQLKAGATKGIDLFDENSFQWFEQYGKSAIQNVMAKAHLSSESAINSMFTDRNSALIIRTYFNKEAQFERDRKLVDGAKGLSGYNALLNTNPQLASMALQKQWQNIMAQLGYSIMPEVLKATIKVVGILKDISAWSHKNPGALKLLAEGAIALGAALIAFGAVAVIAAVVELGPVAIAASAIGAVIGAVGALVLMNWKAVSTFFTNLASSIGKFLSFIFHTPWAHGSPDLPGLPKNPDGIPGTKMQRPWFPFGLGNDRPKPATPPPAAHKTPSSFPVILDGHRLSKAVSYYQGQSISGPQTSLTGYDSSMGFTPPAWSVA